MLDKSTMQLFLLNPQVILNSYNKRRTARLILTTFGVKPNEDLTSSMQNELTKWMRYFNK